MSEAKQRTLNLIMSAGAQSLPLDGRVLTPEMTAEALNTFRGPQGPKGADGTMSFDSLTAEQIEMLRGPKGDPGEDGKDAPQDAYTPSNPPPYPVKSVNGKTGAVALSAADVGALPSGGTAVNANALNGKNASEYALKTDLPTTAADVGALPATGTAADSAKLGGVAASEYIQHSAALTLEEIKASTDLDNKLPKAEAIKNIANDIGDIKTSLCWPIHQAGHSVPSPYGVIVRLTGKSWFGSFVSDSYYICTTQNSFHIGRQENGATAVSWTAI